MNKLEDKIIWTIGHSTKTLDEFIGNLKTFDIKLIADVRSLPGSSKFPQFNKENLMVSLPANEINYIHIPNLGGRRKVNKNSKNTAWQHAAFRGYADYMETANFKIGIDELIFIAEKNRTAIMCAEVLWWKCHRSLIADYLKLNDWKVIHILSNHKTEEHPFTQPAKIKNGKLDYSSEELSENKTE
ncbi:MAG: DUF488 domain-containing protein [Ignavibacteriales bacterium]|nr:DUF488 domain-containing protein [Ignavibacteriales bacterium]